MLGLGDRDVELYRIVEGLEFDNHTCPFEDQHAVSACKLVKICSFDEQGNPVKAPESVPQT